ncbi:MAG: hypothetical protein IEMM0008_0620 [bacterium]|nr:MAG: hypothetical protein IEMM0008_0620 [bacterium]
MKLFISVLLCLSLSIAFGAKKRPGLYDAIKAGDKKSVIRFLKKRVNVNAKRKGKTPLMIATRYGKLDIAKILIEKGANINAKDKSTGQTALHIAIYNKHPSISLLLIDHGAFVNVKGTFRKYFSSNDTAHWTPLHLAARSGQVQVVQQLLKAGALVNTMDEIQKTPLHFAAGRYPGSLHDEPKVPVETSTTIKREQLGITKLLLNNGAEINSINIDGWTPLHYTAQSAHYELAKFLVDNGADINALDKDGHKPFHVAYFRADIYTPYEPKSQYTKIVRLFIRKGMTLNVFPDFLHDDRLFYRKVIVSKLIHRRLKEQIFKSLKGGSDINRKDKDGLSYLHWAAIYNHKELVRLLLSKGADVNAIDNMGRTPLDLSYMMGTGINLKSITHTQKVLQQAGGKLNIHKDLYRAVRKNQVQRVAALINDGADNIIRMNEGESLVDLAKSKAMKTLIRKAGGNRKVDNLLIHAVQNNKMRLVHRLIRKGANVNSSSHYDGNRYSFSQVSNLHLAVKSGNLRLVKVLVNKGANIHAQTKDGLLHGGTTLHWAVFGDDIFLHHHQKASIVRYLLKKGASLKARLTGGRYQGATPLHLAIQNMGDVLYSIQRSSHTWYYKEAIMKYKENYRVIQLLIKHGADINAQIHIGTYKDETPLHWAMNRGLTSVVRLLINKGAKLDPPNHYGMRPLFWALNGGYYNLAVRMIQKGADLHIKNKYDKTPLHLAVACRQTKIVKLLIQKGARINAKDKAGKSPVNYAKSDGMRTILKRTGKP